MMNEIGLYNSMFCFMAFLKVIRVWFDFKLTNIDISTVTISRIIEIYTHILGLKNIPCDIISLLVESVENLLRNFCEEEHFSKIASSLCAFLDALSSIECSQYSISEIESSITTILHLYSYLFSSPFWRYLENEYLITIFYSMKAIFSNVYSLVFVLL